MKPLIFALLVVLGAAAHAGPVFTNPNDTANWLHIGLTENTPSAVPFEIVRPGMYPGDPNVGSVYLRPGMELWLPRTEPWFLLCEPVTKIYIMRVTTTERTLNNLTIDIGPPIIQSGRQTRAFTYSTGRVVNMAAMAPEPAALWLGLMALPLLRRPLHAA